MQTVFIIALTTYAIVYTWFNIEMLSGVRAWLEARKSNSLVYLLTCPWCLGFHVAVWVSVYSFLVNATPWPFAVYGLYILLQKLAPVKLEPPVLSGFLLQSEAHPVTPTLKAMMRDPNELCTRCKHISAYHENGYGFCTAYECDCSELIPADAVRQ